MFIEPEELSALLRQEDDYIVSLLLKWKQKVLPSDTEHKLRIGKRMELLGDLQHKKESSANQNQEVENLKELIKHIQIHSSYRNCGYAHMTSEQKSLYDQIVKERNDDDVNS